MHNFIAPNDRGNSGDLKLVCAVCGEDYVRVADARQLTENTTRLTVQGECGHAFQVDFDFHKGQTDITLDEAKPAAAS